jgi:hypothetical protein
VILVTGDCILEQRFNSLSRYHDPNKKFQQPSTYIASNAKVRDIPAGIQAECRGPMREAIAGFGGAVAGAVP